MNSSKFSKPLTLGINGFGRIGRCVFRVISKLPDFKSGNLKVAINDLTDASMLAHLLKYDSVHGTLDADVKVEGSSLIIDGIKVPVTAEPDPKKLTWSQLNPQIVMECTGRLKKKDETAPFFAQGVKKVMISAPMNDADKTIVMGINHETYDAAKDHVVSNASCTTNCLTPLVSVLDEHFKIIKGTMTTIHSYTNDQRILDLPHADKRRARAAALSMIPTTTGAAKAVGLVMPHLKGKIDGISVRVPTPNVSLVDFCAVVEKNTTVEEVNKALRDAANGRLKGILAVIDEELVSTDFMGAPESSLVDLPSTYVIQGNLVKVLSWYDNEWGFSNRMVELAAYMNARLV